MYMCVQTFIKLSAAVHDLYSALDFGQLYRLRSRISVEWIKQSTSGKRRYKSDFFHTRRNQFDELWSTNEKMTLTIFNRVRAVVKVQVHAKYDQAKCSGS